MTKDLCNGKSSRNGLPVCWKRKKGKKNNTQAKGVLISEGDFDFGLIKETGLIANKKDQISLVSGKFE